MTAAPIAVAISGAVNDHRNCVGCQPPTPVAIVTGSCASLDGLSSDNCQACRRASCNGTAALIPVASALAAWALAVLATAARCQPSRPRLSRSLSLHEHSVLWPQVPASPVLAATIAGCRVDRTTAALAANGSDCFWTSAVASNSVAADTSVSQTLVVTRVRA